MYPQDIPRYKICHHFMFYRRNGTMKADQFEIALGKKLESLRKAKGKTQEEVAGIGISRQAIC